MVLRQDPNTIAEWSYCYWVCSRALDRNLRRSEPKNDHLLCKIPISRTCYSDTCHTREDFLRLCLQDVPLECLASFCSVQGSGSLLQLPYGSCWQLLTQIITRLNPAYGRKRARLTDDSNKSPRIVLPVVIAFLGTGAHFPASLGNRKNGRDGQIG